MNGVLTPGFLAPPRDAEIVNPEEAGIAYQDRRPRLVPWCLRFTSRFNHRTAHQLLVRGDCLQPWLVEGDVVWFDPAVEPRLGDIVACRLKYRCKEGPARGKVVVLTALKQLVRVGSNLGLAANEDCLDARDAEILGPVTAWHRPGWWRRPSLLEMDLRPQSSKSNT